MILLFSLGFRTIGDDETEGYDVLLTEGLLGGELTTARSLFDLKRHKPKLSYEGLQDVDGCVLPTT